MPRSVEKDLTVNVVDGRDRQRTTKTSWIQTRIQRADMMTSSVLLVYVTSVVIATVIGLAGSSQVFTSTLKIQRMFQEEGNLLKHLKTFMDNEQLRLEKLSRVYIDRIQQIKSSKFQDDLRHPNAVYKVIQWFSNFYGDALDDRFDSFKASMDQTEKAHVPGKTDVKQAIKSLIYLQSVYDLNATDMVKGNYLNVQGPPLSCLDAFRIGDLALTGGNIKESIQWLKISLEMYHAGCFQKEDNNLTVTIKARLGKAHLVSGNKQIAEELLNETLVLDPEHNDVKILSYMWTNNETVDSSPTEKEDFKNYSRLCKQKREQYFLKPVSPLVVCRYKETVLPYYRFQEEILSVSPFISLFYNVISDDEGDYVKEFVKDRLMVNKQQLRGLKFTSPTIKSGQTAKINDDESAVIASISRRIESITGLNTDQRLPNGPSSAEPFEVVNFGLGGRRDVKNDLINADLSFTTKAELKTSGERIATVQISLSDVEIGGSTVFTLAGISVSPVKNAALLWFNFNPALQLDDLSIQGECPVVIGQKWSMSKHIWTYGNTFRRRCGPSPDVTQLDIEPNVRNGYQ